MLLHLVSAQEENPGKAYQTVRGELEAYGHGLADKLEIVALSQVDTLDADARKKAAALKRAAGRAPICFRRSPAKGSRSAAALRGGRSGAAGGEVVTPSAAIGASPSRSAPRCWSIEQPG